MENAYSCNGVVSNGHMIKVIFKVEIYLKEELEKLLM